MIHVFSMQNNIKTEDVDLFYKQECTRILNEYKNEMKKVFAYEMCEIDRSFLGFLDVYATIEMPKDFTVIDFGCNQAVQAQYFKDCQSYIGIDIIPNECRFEQKNAKYYSQTIQDFIENELPKLVENGLDLNKTFAFCSYVPSEEIWQMVANNFKYNRVIYCSDVVSENLPPVLNYHECLSLLKELVNKDILKFDFENPDNILVYREKSEKEKEGWYSVNIFEAAQELLNDGTSQQYLMSVYEEKIGKPYKENNTVDIDRSCDFEI